MSDKYQLLPPLTADEYERLKADIALRGVMVAVEVDENGNVLDGHNRMRIAAELGIECPTVVRRGLPEHEKRLHAVTLNLARRQLTDAQRVLIGRKIEPDLAARAKARMSAGGGDKKSAQNGSGMEKFPDPIEQTTTRDEIAAEVGLGTGRTYENHKQTLADAETLAESDPIVAEVLAAIESGEADMADVRKAIKPHVSNNSGQNEWYTPAEYIAAARRLLGEIDLDPASSDMAQRTVQAATYYTKDDDGLSKPWAGRVWMNPPYAQPLISQFIETLIASIESGAVTEAVVLVNNATDTRWAQRLMLVSSAICFPAGRVRFIDQTGKASGAPLQGQMVCYLGDQLDEFYEMFSKFGYCAISDALALPDGLGRADISYSRQMASHILRTGNVG